MKIVHLIDYYQPKIGYQEYFLAREHAIAGNNTYVLTSDRYFPFPDYEKIYLPILGKRVMGSGERIEENIKTIRLKSLEIPGSNLIILRNLNKTLKRINPDLVLCHGIYSITSFSISKIKKTFNFKLIYDNHAAAFNTDFNSSFIKILYHSFYKIFFKDSIIHNADNIFAIGEAERDFITENLKLAKKNIPLIRLGVDVKVFKPSKIFRNSIRNKLKIKKTETVIIFTGKITENKNVHVLLEALEKSKRLFNLLLIGNGPQSYLDNLKYLSKRTKIIHIPFILNKDLPMYFSAADIAVYPGDFTISVFEAMSMSLPVILPEWIGNEFLNNIPGVFRFDRNDKSQLLQLLNTLDYNNKLIQKLGSANRNFVKKNLDWKKIAKSVVDIV